MILGFETEIEELKIKLWVFWLLGLEKMWAIKLAMGISWFGAFISRQKVLILSFGF